MAHKKRTGFTLVEMLVVIAIIAMLAAMVMPAVQMATESARVKTCLNNQKQLCVGLITYEANQNEFPGYVNAVLPAGRTNGARRTSWVIMIYPNIGRGDAWEKWRTSNRGDASIDKFNDMLVCPSDFPDGLRLTQLSYVANCGKRDSSRAESDRVANGIFHNRYLDPKSNVVGMRQLETKASTTLLMTENIQAKNWNVEPEIRDENQAWIVEKFVGFVWDTPKGINQGMEDGDEARDNSFARPSSNHPGGVNVFYCDGSGQFMREGINPDVLTALMCVDLKRSDARNKDYIIDDADYK